MFSETETWQIESVGGHPSDVYRPGRRHPAGYVLIYLHGVHQSRLVDKPVFCREFSRHGLVVVAPHSRRSWWSDRICPEFDRHISAQQHLLDSLLPWIREQFGAQPPKIGLWGTSMGGQGALRLAYKFPQLFPVVAAIAPAIDFHLWMHELEPDDPLWQMYLDPETARQDTAILHVHPLNWPRYQFFCCDPTDDRWYEGSDRLRMKLLSLGIPFQCDLETSGGGHGFAYYEHMAPRVIQFLVDSLVEVERQFLTSSDE